MYASLRIPHLGRVRTPLAAAITILGIGCVGRAPGLNEAPASSSWLEFHEGSHLAFDLSPDGRTIAFDLLGQLWLLPVEGGEARAITDTQRDTVDYREPLFSPDGEHLLYSSDQADTVTFWKLSLRTGDQERVGGEVVPRAWSADGRALLVTRMGISGGEARTSIHRIALQSDSAPVIPIAGLPHPSVRDAVPTPDGQRIAFINTAVRLDKAGRVWEVPAEGGTAVPLTPKVRAMAPAYAPDGQRVAYFAPDSAGILQVWIVDRNGNPARQITQHTTRIDLENCWWEGRTQGTPHCDERFRVRWTPDGDRLIYAWDGRLWSVSSAGGAAKEIPFTVRIQFAPPRRNLPPVNLPEAGARLAARGHTGLAISPDGRHVAMLVLDSLWVATIGGSARALTGTGSNASSLSWSPDGKHLLWSGGRRGAEDVFVTEAVSGRTQRLTQLPGVELQAAWSPDGRHLAFVHTDTVRNASPRLLVALASAEMVVSTRDQVRDLGPALTLWRSSAAPQERLLQWSPDGTALLMHPIPIRGARTVTLVPLSGERRDVPVPRTVSYLRWVPDGSLVYTEANQLRRVAFRPESGASGEPTLLDSDAATNLSVARDGSLLFVSGDGLRVRRPDGRTEHPGWPVSGRVPTPAPLLLRNVRLVDGTGAPATAPRDVLLQGGRIARIAAAGTLRPAAGMQVVDAGRRIAIPGLIDAHQHVGQGEGLLPALLYNGVTTIRVPHSRLPWLAAMRDAVHAGVRPGPRMVIGAHFAPGCFRQDCERSESGQFTVSRDDARRGLQIARAYGAEWGKMYIPFTTRAGTQFIEEAHALGLRVTGHTAHTLPLLAAGMDGKEHGAQGGDRTLPRLQQDMVDLSRLSGLVVTPTISFEAQVPRILDDSTLLADLATAALYGPDPRKHAILDIEPANRPWTESIIRDWHRRIFQYHQAGVPVAVGTDGSLPWLVHLELDEFVRAGLTPLEAIRAGTSVTADALGLGGELGTLAVGKRADLVIVDGDPTANIRDTRRIWRVIQGGHVIDRNALLESIRDQK